MEREAVTGARALGDQLKARRMEAGLSLEELQRRTGVPMGWISRMERGVMTDPKFRTVVKLSKELGLSPNQVAAILGVWYQLEEIERYPELTKLTQAYMDASPNKQAQADHMLEAVQAILES